VLAQSSTTHMPEGTTDIDIGLVAALVPRAEGRSEVRAVILPTATAQWSNGVFLSPGQIGMHLSEEPMLRYGPVINYGARTRRAGSTDSGSGVQLEPGAFVDYAFAYNIHFNASLVYGGGDNGGGVRLNTGARYGMRLTAHQSASLGVGAEFGNGSYMDSYFGVTPAQAGTNGRSYQPGGGLKKVYLDLGWRTELSTKFSLSAFGRVSQLTSRAADSPLVLEPRSTILGMALSYHY
jgi:outer membrane protein